MSRPPVLQMQTEGAGIRKTHTHTHTLTNTSCQGYGGIRNPARTALCARSNLQCAYHVRQAVRSIGKQCEDKNTTSNHKQKEKPMAG